MEFQVKKAKREKLKSAIALLGASGSGKTLSALLIAYGMMKEIYPDLSEEKLWEKIGLVDSERKRSLVYANTTHQGVHIGEFWHIPLEPPYTVDRYSGAVKALKDAGAEVVIVDSTSHAWEGDGGLQDLQQDMGGNFQAWREVNPVYTKFIDLIMGELHDVHMISTVRLKQKHEVSTSETGKLEVKKLGLKPVQRDSLEYELQIVFNLEMNHMASASKDNSSLFDGRKITIDADVGRDIAKWLDKGEDVQAEQRKERENTLKMIKDYEKQYGEPVTQKIRGIEQHPTIQRTVDEMPLDWLKKTLYSVEMKVAELKKSEEAKQVDNEKSNKSKSKKDKESVK